MDRIAYIHRCGVGVYLDGETLRAYPASRLDTDLRSFIRDHREEFVDALQVPKIEITVGNILALSPEELEQYRREIEAAADDRPHIDHDREAWRRAQSIIRQRREEVAA